MIRPLFILVSILAVVLAQDELPAVNELPTTNESVTVAAAAAVVEATSPDTPTTTTTTSGGVDLPQSIQTAVSELPNVVKEVGSDDVGPGTKELQVGGSEFGVKFYFPSSWPLWLVVLIIVCVCGRCCSPVCNLSFPRVYKEHKASQKDKGNNNKKDEKSTDVEEEKLTV